MTFSFRSDFADEVIDVEKVTDLYTYNEEVSKPYFLRSFKQLNFFNLL